ncbi:hypothetical protein [Pseudomonas sp. Q1]|uniref:hypothetical protein n=1 Tax=Pseudomonas sp. Q1 TaxID=2202823 RepID=UPI001374E40E|nr:hypothetical protein [Pseudomonas sp. Q1]NCE83466.1 hypothetical protein [Pseudomonas sp. Q1]
MKNLKSISAAWRNRKKKTWAELNDWALALIGVPSFLVGSFYGLIVKKVTPEMVDLSQIHGLPHEAILAFLFLGGLALSSWYFLNVARRCSQLLYERNFK